MISDLFELRQVLLGLVESGAACDGCTHHGDPLKLGPWIKLHISTARVSVVSVDCRNIAATTLYNDVAGVTFLFLPFLIWHENGWQLGLNETRKGNEKGHILQGLCRSDLGSRASPPDRMQKCDSCCSLF